MNNWYLKRHGFYTTRLLIILCKVFFCFWRNLGMSSSRQQVISNHYLVTCIRRLIVSMAGMPCLQCLSTASYRLYPGEFEFPFWTLMYPHLGAAILFSYDALRPVSEPYQHSDCSNSMLGTRVKIYHADNMTKVGSYGYSPWQGIKCCVCFYQFHCLPFPFAGLVPVPVLAYFLWVTSLEDGRSGEQGTVC